MMRYLCISVTLLDQSFHGTGDGGIPEWPPSPMRLFEALLAGARCGCREAEWSPERADAFRWLERQPAPMIVGPAAERGAAYTLFVPNNDGDVEAERQDRLTSKTVRAQWLRDVRDVAGVDGSLPSIHYLWPIQDADWAEARVHAELLCREARRLVALGWGIDQAVAEGRILTDDEAQALPGRRWRAWRVPRVGSESARVPASGSLTDLEDVHRAFVQRIRGREYQPTRQLRRFEVVQYLSSQTLPARPYAVFELSEGVAFQPQRAATVAAMLRSLACRLALSDTHEFPGGTEVYVAGHVDTRRGTPPRFSYLPLPTIGHAHADGMIRRVLIAEPFGGNGAQAEWAQQRLRNALLRNEQGNDQGMLLDLWRPGSRAVVGRYVDEAEVWSTVTPVILPGLDDGKQSKAERLFLKAVEQAGIPIEGIAELALRKAPWWPGAQHPGDYFVPNYIRKLSRWHVRVRFCEAVPGPLAIGAGRHVGLGVFAAAERGAVGR